MKTKNTEDVSPFMSAKEIASLLRCSRSSVSRIADRQRFTRLFLGSGERGMVRYMRSDIEKYLSKRTHKPAAAR
ncbi:MAG: helix-turn-helix domain-containing protein [Geobacteraceae bacterium]|nr:helix-turn-helix domain-containing protein [Geobacteraceae bacterium]